MSTQSHGSRRRYLSALSGGFAALVFVTAWHGSGSTAQAGPTRLGLHGAIGVGGELEGELETDALGALDPDDEQDLDLSLGAGFSYDAAVAKILSLGVGFGLSSWSADEFTWENGDNGGLAFDLSFRPRLRFPARRLELYAAVPLGVSAVSKDDNQVLGADIEYDVGWGYHVGLFGGLQFPIDRDMALFVEIGWLTRKVTVRGEAEADGDVDGEIQLGTGQLTVAVGLALF